MLLFGEDSSPGEGELIVMLKKVGAMIVATSALFALTACGASTEQKTAQEVFDNVTSGKDQGADSNSVAGAVGAIGPIKSSGCSLTDFTTKPDDVGFTENGYHFWRATLKCDKPIEDGKDRLYFSVKDGSDGKSLSEMDRNANEIEVMRAKSPFNDRYQ